MVAAMLLSFGLWACEDTPVEPNGGDTPGGGNTSVEWVDLGLPSGTMWASQNVGATSPEGYGSYFAWGETTPKSYYDWNTYRFGEYAAFTKYCSEGWGLNGFFDNKTTLEPADDAATANMGSEARMPTRQEWQELLANTTITTTTRNGVTGRLVTGRNGKSIFLPCAGYKRYGDLVADGQGGFYWSSSRDEEGESSNAWHFYFGSTNPDVGVASREYGYPVRAVRATQTTEEWVDLGLPSGKKWASHNVGAASPEGFGNYYAWGEITTKSYYDWSTYRFGEYAAFTKYCSEGDGLNGFFDNKTTLEPEDDAATANMGNGARMPTRQEWQELLANTTITTTTRNGVTGRLVTGRNGKSIFLPCAGYKRYGDLVADGQGGFYWSSSIGEDSSPFASHFYFGSTAPNVGDGSREYGYTVRAIKD